MTAPSKRLNPLARLVLANISRDGSFVPQNTPEANAVRHLLVGGFVALTVTDAGVGELKHPVDGRRGPAPKPEKWALAQSLRDSGHTLEAVGKVLGVTRERVRQKTKKPVGINAREVDPMRLIAALRQRDVWNIPDLAKAANMSDDRVRRCLAELGMSDAAHRLMHWRRTFPERNRVSTVIRDVAARLGRTPTISEISRALGVGPTAAAPKLVATFGSIRAAMLYCDLEPRSVGYPGRPNAIHNARVSA